MDCSANFSFNFSTLKAFGYKDGYKDGYRVSYCHVYIDEKRPFCMSSDTLLHVIRHDIACHPTRFPLTYPQACMSSDTISQFSACHPTQNPFFCMSSDTPQFSTHRVSAKSLDLFKTS